MEAENKKITINPKAELKERIIEAAMDAFMKHGIKSITMDDIANSLSISKRTLYETFKDKEDLLIACLEHKEKLMHEFMEQVAQESENVLEIILKFYKKTIEVYHSTNKRFFEDMHKYPRVMEMNRANREHNSEDAIQFFKKGVEQGIFRSDLNFEIINLLTREQFNLLIHTDFCKDYSFIEVYESIMFVYMRGISTEKGQKILEDFIQEYRQHNV